MKVILLQFVKGVGKAEEVKEVSDGYARNFLFPNKLAIPASQSALAELSGKHKKATKEASDELEAEQKVASRLDGFELEITERASPNGKLFAAITAATIMERLAKAGFKVKKEQVHVKTIKEAGTFPATIVFKHGIEASITIIVSVM